MLPASDETVAEVTRLLKLAEEQTEDERFAAAHESLAQLEPILQAQQDMVGLSRTALRMGQLAEQAGDTNLALRDYQQAALWADQAGAAGDPQLKGIALHRQAHLLRFAEPAQAREGFAAAQAASAAAGDLRGKLLSAAMIGQIDLTQGNPESGMQQILAALDAMPVDMPEREHLIEHVNYLSNRLESALYRQLLQQELHDPALQELLLNWPEPPAVG